GLGGTAVPFLAEKLTYIFVRDITARKQAEEQISELNQQLEQRVQALTEVNSELEAFNYSISHDLRAPLRSMSSFAQALLEEEATHLSPTGLEYAGRITRSAKYMDTLLQDMLTYSRLARAEMAPAPIPLEEPIKERLGGRERERNNSRAHVEVSAPRRTVSAHVPTLKQVRGNRPGNSLKLLAADRPA